MFSLPTEVIVTSKKENSPHLGITVTLEKSEYDFILVMMSHFGLHCEFSERGRILYEKFKDLQKLSDGFKEGLTVT